MRCIDLARAGYSALKHVGPYVGKKTMNSCQMRNTSTRFIIASDSIRYTLTYDGEGGYLSTSETEKGT